MVYEWEFAMDEPFVLDPISLPTLEAPMLKGFTTLITLGLLLSACVGGPPPAPPPPPPLDPTGTYDIFVAFDGGELRGVVDIRGSAGGGYTGTVDTDMGGAALAGIRVDGQTLYFSVPEAGVNAQVVFTEDRFTGTMQGDMGVATLSGTRRPAR
jgi:hypothetical protein